MNKDTMEEEKSCEGMSRKEKRKAMKKTKRKLLRKEAAEREREEEEARLKDPEEQRRIQLMEQQEAERMERDRIMFEERERAWMEMIQQQQQQQQHLLQQSYPDDVSDEYEYVEEEGPPEIIWQGNEIIFKRKQVKVRVRDRNDDTVKDKESNQNEDEDDDYRPTSNPLPPESPTLMLDNVAQQVPNFGTEQDKAHCPFHLKTGACRFGLRCSRVHFYPDKCCTLLIKNMYNGPGLAWEQDEGLEVCSCSFILSDVIQVLAYGAMLQTNGHDLQRV
ncbi:hypothetical protein VNO77_22458 [Canavalia gladiata]|uniref:C3H1-type domain-containing protein n=1 Tax=Canavalia gladiata TaxID=3824 RepID=A0AAN9QB10_CANGL